MRRRMLFIFALPLMLAGVVMTASPALAVSPHFVKSSAQLSGTNLVVSFKEAGLGNNVTVTETASAQASATYVCVNGGGANPAAANKTTVNAEVSKSGQFTSDKNGNVIGSLTIAPPSAGAFTCPPGQSLQLAQVSYSSVAITDATNGVTEQIPGTFTTGCLLPNVRGAC